MRTVCRFNLQVLVMTGVAILAAGGVAGADFTFGPVKNLGPVVNGPGTDDCPNVSADGLALYFSSVRPGSLGGYDLWVCTRPSVQAEWGAPVNLGAPVNSVYYEAYPSVSTDGLTLYFCDPYTYNPEIGTRLPEGSTDPFNSEVWMSTRATTSDPWGPVVNAGPSVNSEGSEFGGVTISPDGLTLISAATGPGRPGSGYLDLWMCSRSTEQEPWSPAVNLGPAVNSAGMDSGPCLSPDGSALFFESFRGPPLFVFDLWGSFRKSKSDPWGPAVKLDASINTSDKSEWNPALSPDGKTLYFASDRPGGYGEDDLYEAAIVPVVDFNADGKVDLADLQRLIESWGQDDPAVDIGPMPWGDGTVDVKDLKVLVDHWTEDASNPI